MRLRSVFVQRVASCQTNLAGSFAHIGVPISPDQCFTASRPPQLHKATIATLFTVQSVI